MSDAVHLSVYITSGRPQRLEASLHPYCSTQILPIQIRRPALIGLSIDIQMNPHHDAAALSVNEPDQEAETMSPLPAAVKCGVVLA